MPRYRCIQTPGSEDPDLYDLEVMASDGRWRFVKSIPRNECRNYTRRGLSAEIVAAYVRNNNISAADFPGLITDVHTSLNEIVKPAGERVLPPPAPPVLINKSVQPDYIVSLENGKHYKSLKRHLSGLGLTPEEYRAKWQLPANYPMVAPNYSKQRSKLAKAIGLGRKSSEGRKSAGTPKKKGLKKN